MAISSKDIEILWKRNSEEGSKRGISVTQYFESNGVPYHVFEKWYKKKFTQPAVVNCVVSGSPDALPIGAGFAVGYTVLGSWWTKREMMRNSPYTYLLRVKNNFSKAGRLF